MRIFIPTAAWIFLLSVACDDDKEIKQNIVIKTGRECGWCGGRDSLVISKKETHFFFDNPCDDSKDKETHEETHREEWHKLLSTLNWDDFTSVNANTCAICADGCDTWIWIQNNDSSHQIRFTEGSPEIAPIQTFVDKLDALHQDFR